MRKESYPFIDTFVKSLNEKSKVADMNPLLMHDFFKECIAFLHLLASQSRKTRFLPPKEMLIVRTKED